MWLSVAEQGSKSLTLLSFHSRLHQSGDEHCLWQSTYPKSSLIWFHVQNSYSSFLSSFYSFVTHPYPEKNSVIEYWYQQKGLPLQNIKTEKRPALRTSQTLWSRQGVDAQTHAWLLCMTGHRGDNGQQRTCPQWRTSGPMRGESAHRSETQCKSLLTSKTKTFGLTKTKWESKYSRPVSITKPWFGWFT